MLSWILAALVVAEGVWIVTLVERLQAANDAVDKMTSAKTAEDTELATDQAQIEQDKATIAALQAQVDAGTITPEAETLLESLEAKLGISQPTPPPAG